MNPDLHVRRALLNLPEDAAAYRVMLDHYASDPLGQGVPLDPELLDRVVDDLREHPCCFVYLAFLGEQAVGFATCFRGYSTFKGAPLMNIHDIAVHREHRRQGIARALLQGIAEEATLLGCCRLTLEVRDDNSAARALYERCGFGVSQPGGKEMPHHFMERPLGRAG